MDWVAGGRFTTINELRDGSQLVVLVAATGNTSLLMIEQEPGSSSKVTAQVVEYVVVRPPAKGGDDAQQGDLISVVEPIHGISSLPRTGYAILFLNEYAYWLNERPAGSATVYGAAGGPQGIWIDQDGVGILFHKTDDESPDLPSTIDQHWGTT